MYCSYDIERLFIRYKAEVIPLKSMIQGYKTSNRTSTTKDNRNQKPVLEELR
ncbi:unknown [Bacteroides sp. CAG:443]|nr:unknown [Bacteroides sp. CAG:443]